MAGIDFNIEYLTQSVKLGQLPTYLYKYNRINEKFISRLINSEINFSNPNSFNDPFDCQIDDQTEWTKEKMVKYLEIYKTQFSEITIKLAKSMPPNLFSDFFKKAIKESVNQIGVTCFSKSSNNLLLWSHYASSHAGICLKFDILKDPNFFYWTFPIHYTNSYPVFNFDIGSSDLSKKIILTKSKHWSYEDEYRTLKKTSDYHKFEKQSLTEVNFGCKAKDNDIRETIQKLKTSGFSHVNFKKAILSNKKFELEFIDL